MSLEQLKAKQMAAVAPKAAEEAKPLARVFKSWMPSNTMLLDNGKPCIFRNGRYITDKPEEIEFFEKEIALGNVHIYVDSAEREVQPQESVEDLMERIRKEAYAQAVKDMAGGKGDAGDSAPVKNAGILTSQQISDIATNAGATITPATK